MYLFIHYIQVDENLLMFAGLKNVDELNQSLDNIIVTLIKNYMFLNQSIFLFLDVAFHDVYNLQLLMIVYILLFWEYLSFFKKILLILNDNLWIEINFSL